MIHGRFNHIVDSYIRYHPTWARRAVRMRKATLGDPHFRPGLSLRGSKSWCLAGRGTIGAREGEAQVYSHREQ